MTVHNEETPNLDKHTVQFTIKETNGKLQAGDTLIIRDVQNSADGLLVAAISEKALKDEAAKIFK